MIGLKRGSVKLVPYNPQWRVLYEQEKSLLINTLTDDVLSIEHIGSTSIPHISAKPIIDITVGVKNIDDFSAVQKNAKKLETIGYEWRKLNSDPNHQLFSKGPEEKRIVYLHFVQYEGEIWTNDLLFRNYLRKDSNIRQEYELLKTKLATQFPNERVKYSRGKRGFITKVLNEAKKIGNK